MRSPVTSAEGCENVTMQRKVKLDKIANILNGLPSGRLLGKANTTGVIRYNFIQPNNLGIFNDILGTSEIKGHTAVDDSYFIRQNDILLKRLNPDIATLIIEDMPNTLFSSNLFVIRLVKDYHPAYIASLLENKGMNWLNSNIIGSAAAIKSISAKSLAMLDIPAIDYYKQKAIGQMWLLYKKRRKLLVNMIEEDRKLMAAVINNIAASTEEEV
ncbi:MAG: hypothetical protein A4E53_03491 [Pelotomaculum sp. PtaB.Bin104]|nr:MAG: hypothetical protein A4E53_03491 [Pelotomaculum sp. PtaB.Bin104]